MSSIMRLYAVVDRANRYSALVRAYTLAVAARRLSAIKALAA